MKSVIRIISDKKTILYTFLAVHLIGLIWLLVTGGTTEHQHIPYEEMLLLNTLSLLAYVLIVYFTLKKRKLAIWLMAAILLLTGVMSTLIGIFIIEWHQYLVKPYFIMFGIYFVYGGVALIRKPVLEKRQF